VYLNKIRQHLGIVVTTDKEQGNIKEEFLYDGRYGMNGECMLFPSKDKTTWEGFVPPCKFKDGDILYIDCTGDECSYKHNKYIFILKEISDGKIYCYCYIDEVNKYKKFNISWLSDMTYTPRFATEEEKQKLFDAIKENGYKWNAETKILEKLEDVDDKGNISDGYHTFNELYEYRLLYNASMFNELAKQGLYDVHKSKRHSDGTIPFGDENWFIVQAELPTGQISNHYEMKEWDLFNIPEKEKANTYDGHSPQDVAKRLRDFLSLEKLVKSKFKDGDIISDSLDICIFKREGNISGTVDFYCGRDYIGNLVIKDSNKPDSHFGNIVDYKLATEEEKQKLFDAIGVNGLKWNAETKTLEKSTIPMYKFRRSRTANDLIEQFRKTPVNSLDIPIVVDDKEVGDVQFGYDEKRKKYVFNFLLKDK
jgi:hypothetical protein